MGKNGEDIYEMSYQNLLLMSSIILLEKKKDLKF